MGITVQHGNIAYWGPHVFLQGSGEAEEIRGAYARESAEWPPLHFAIAEATPEALDPWYRLGFAQMHAYGMCESGGERAPAPGVTIRRGGPEDIDTALRIDQLIAEAQAVSPSYSAVAAEEAPDRAGWEEVQQLRTNWRVTNLAASRFWPARGFQLTHIRLVRRLPDV